MKIQNFKSKFKSFILLHFLIVLLTFNFLLLTLPVLAQTSSPSADLKQKLKSLQEEIASKAAKIKVEVSQRLQNRVYIGLLKVKSDNTLTFATQKGTRIVTVNEYTSLVGTSKTGKSTSLSLKNLEADDKLVALGDIDETETLTAKKVIKLPVTSALTKTLSFGKITSYQAPELTIKTPQGQSVTFSTTKDTTYQEGEDQISSSGLAAGKTVIVVSIKGESSAKVRFVYLLQTPEISPTLEPLGEATSPAKKASPSASFKKPKP